MKIIIIKCLTILELLMVVSCKKESATLQSLPVTVSGSTEVLLTEIDRARAISSIKIGTQRWMTKNLDVETYRNGDRIPQVKDADEWATLTTGAWCYYNNDPDNGAIYGKLYNWYAVNDPRGLAPIDYHIPGNKEWTTLSAFLGGEAVAGGKMKEIGTAHWLAPNTDATNSSGFTGLPGGRRYDTGLFFAIGSQGMWWTSNRIGPFDAWFRTLSYNFGGIGKANWLNLFGYSVRCVKD
ncbi:fibrobacter succinogenes major paralogous domain-containing protein [soil metagenome]